jgi:hypothetical protein
MGGEGKIAEADETYFGRAEHPRLDVSSIALHSAIDRRADSSPNLREREGHKNHDLNDDNPAKLRSKRLLPRLVPEDPLPDYRSGAPAERRHHQERGLGYPPHPVSGAMLVPSERQKSCQIDRQDIRRD